MSSFTENRMNIIGNQAVNDLVVEMNRRFKEDIDQNNISKTAVGRILFGLSGDSADLTESVIMGARSVAYINETNWRPNNAISFVVINGDASSIQDHITKYAYMLDPKVIVVNTIREEGYSKSVCRISLFYEGQLINCNAVVNLPNANYDSLSGSKRLIKYEKQAQMCAYMQLKKYFFLDKSLFLSL